MSHANAALTPRARLRVAQLVVDHGESIREAAARFRDPLPPAEALVLDAYASAA